VSVLFAFAAQLRAFVLPGLFVLFTARSAGGDWQVWAMALLVPYTLVAVGRYLSYRYRYEAHEMVIRSGLLFRNERHVPYARIQNIDAVQNLFHRLFGVAEVRVETGAGREPEAKLSVLPVAALEEMRRRVFAGRAERERGAAPPAVAAAEARGEGPAGAPAAAAPAGGRALLHLPPRELALFGLIQNRGAVVLAAAFGVLWEVGLLDRLMGRFVGEGEAGEGAARDLALSLLGRGGFPAGRIALGLAAFAGLLLVLRLMSVGWSVVRLHGFRLGRDGDDLRAEFGLFTRVATTLPLRRIQTLTVREGPLHRLFRRASVRVETAGGGGGEAAGTQREWLAPIVRPDALPGLLREVMPELDLAAAAWNPAPPRAFRRVLKRWSFGAAAIALPFVVLLRGWDLALLAVLLAAAAFGARRHVAHLGWAVTDGAVLFRSGWIWRQVSVAPFGKIQAVALRESPFDRRAAMARVRVDTAGAGELSHRVDIPYLPRETARGLYHHLAAQAARTAFRW
jgi:putative membrane protein